MLLAAVLLSGGSGFGSGISDGSYCLSRISGWDNGRRFDDDGSGAGGGVAGGVGGDVGYGVG
jgi:hypothetical protein